MPTVPAALRRRVIELAGAGCEYCRLPASHSPNSFAVDHIHPRSRQGEDEEENLSFCCPGCNSSKYNKTHALDPATGVLVPLFHPRRQKLSEHFRWSADFLTVIGLTEVGRATVEALQLNREGVQNLRELLASSERHPPREDTSSNT